MSTIRQALVAAVAAFAMTVGHAQTMLSPPEMRQRMVQGDIRAAAPIAAHDGESLKRRVNGIRPRGFIGPAGGPFTTVDVPGATTFTLVLGANEAGHSVGTYIDRAGRIHGFRRDARGGFRRIDFPGAVGSVAWRINASGQIVGAWSEKADTPALDMEHGFLLDDGKFTRIEFPGAVLTQAHAINNRGQIVGEYRDRAGRYHGFLLDEGMFTTIDAPGGTSTKAFDIDDNGRIVGVSLNASLLANVLNPGGSPVRGFLRDVAGAFTSIEAPDTTQTTVFGINNAGQIVGQSIDDRLVAHGFLLDGNAFTTIDAGDPARGTIVADINDAGQLIGVLDVVTHGFVLERDLAGQRGGRIRALDHPDAVGITQPFGINNRGEIVGYYEDAAGTRHAFLHEGRRLTTIDVPGALGSEAKRINDRGQIVGVYSTLDTRELFPARGFLRDGGTVIQVDLPGALHTQPGDIDSTGRIVGEYQDAAGMFHGFLRDPTGAFTTIDVPGALATSILGINDDGAMVGLQIDADGAARSFLRDPEGAFSTIEVPGAALTNARDINNVGEIVGSFIDEATVRGFILRNGKYTTIDVPDNVVATHVSGISDRGRIVGIRD